MWISQAANCVLGLWHEDSQQIENGILFWVNCISKDWIWSEIILGTFCVIRSIYVLPSVCFLVAHRLLIVSRFSS
jgi:hypothetical protein